MRPHVRHRPRRTVEQLTFPAARSSRQSKRPRKVGGSVISVRVTGYGKSISRTNRRAIIAAAAAKKRLSANSRDCDFAFNSSIFSCCASCLTISSYCSPLAGVSSLHLMLWPYFWISSGVSFNRSPSSALRERMARSLPTIESSTKATFSAPLKKATVRPPTMIRF